MISIDTSGVLSSQAAEPKEMLSVSEQGDVTHVRINFSSLSLLQECARKSQYALLRGLKPSLESPALLFGSAIHKGLETYYSGERTERALPKKYRETMQMIGCGQWEPDWAESLLFRAARAFVEKAAPLSALPDENKRSIVTGVWMLQHYFESYITDEYVIMRDEQGPVVERKLEMLVLDEPELKITIFGTIDCILRSEVTEQVLICDHKTASSLYNFYDKISPNAQYTAYIMLAREVLKYDTDLFLVNALQVKQPPKTARGSAPDFARQITQRTEEDFRELKMAVTDMVRDFIRNKKRNFFPMSTGACVSAYGSCQFREICASPPQLRGSIIQAKFRENSYGKS